MLVQCLKTAITVLAAMPSTGRPAPDEAPAPTPPETPAETDVRTMHADIRSARPYSQRPALTHLLPRQSATTPTTTPAPLSTGTACLPCGRHHISAISGALGEALRFARSDGLNSPEVISRLTIADEEMDVMERVDLAPAKIAGLGPKDKEDARWLANESRSIRHVLDSMGSVEDLERAAGKAQNLGIELRARMFKLSAEDTVRLKALVKNVREGRISKEKALESLKR